MLAYIVRHGQTDYNLRNIVQGGGVDSSLNTTGRSQAAQLFNQYKEINFDLIVTSALKRTTETVQSFIDLGIPTIQNPDLNEMGWGDMEGQESSPASRLEYKKLIDAWDAGDHDARMPNGESLTELTQRLMRFQEWMYENKKDKILVATHGRTLRCLTCILQHRPLTDMRFMQHSNTGLFLFDLESRPAKLLKKNDTSHLSTN